MAALFTGRPVHARSTLAPLFGEAAIAGPGIEQTVPLHLHLFPGDGEAILSVRLSGDPARLHLQDARSSLGRTRINEGTVEIDYRTRPVGREQVDTLVLTMVARTAATPLRWQSALSTSADSAMAPGAPAQLAVAPPLQVAFALEPDLVYAGEQLTLKAVVTNTDSRDVDEVSWQWPAGLVVDAEEHHHRWTPSLAPGKHDTLVWKSRIDTRTTGSLVVQGRADAAAVSGSPLAGNPLRVVAGPLVQVAPATGQWLEKGRPGRLLCQWQNTGEAAMQIDAWQVEIPASFSGVRVIQASQGRAVLQQDKVQVLEVGILAPGQIATLELEATPARSGPFNWNCAFRPAQRRDFIAVAGQTALRVAEPQNAAAPAPAAAPYTDLELLRQAFAEAAGQALSRLPLAPGRGSAWSPSRSRTRTGCSTMPWWQC